MTGKRYELTDNQWDQVKHYFEISNKNGRPYKNLKNTIKIHAAVDALGNPIKIILTGGQVHDIKIAPKLIIDFKAKIVMADGAYDSDDLRRQIRKFGGTDCIKKK